MSVTLTGDNDYSGIYTDVDVLGAAIAGSTGGTFSDTNQYDGGNETFLFGDLQHKSTVDSSGDTTSGTWNTTATGTGGDTMVFSFTLHESTGGSHDFLTEAAPHDYASDATSFLGGNGFNAGDGDATYQAQSDDSAWHTNYLNWVDSLTDSTFSASPNDATAYDTALGNALSAAETAGYTFSDPTTIETNVNHNNNDPDVNLTFDITATAPGTSTLTADYGGNKILLGFTVDPTQGDHIGLSSVPDEATFAKYFTINADTHISANANVVNDTVISLGNFTANTGTSAGDHGYGTSAGGWSVDLYGVDVATLNAGAAAANGGAGESLQKYVYDTIVAH